MGEFVLPSGVVLTSSSASFLPLPGFVDGVGGDDKHDRDTKEYPLRHPALEIPPP